MTQFFKPPKPVPNNIVNNDSVQAFIAGSINMGASVDWQVVVENQLAGFNDKLQVLNPRRTDWDASWEQRMSNPEFRNQVIWELKGIDNSDFVLFHFETGSLSPISLLELGRVSMRADAHECGIISCHPDFYRYGNIEIVADDAGMKLFDNLDDAVALLTSRIKGLLGAW